MLHTELGPLELSPGEIAVVPRGIRFRVELPDGPARGYLCENYGAPFTLPERGPIGANGLANERDFLAPTAAFEERGHAVRWCRSSAATCGRPTYDHSPLDVVAWHGNYVPYKYDTANFMVLGTVSFDHPDPSILPCSLRRPIRPGLANVRLRHLPAALAGRRGHLPAALVPPQRDGELMGLVEGAYDAKAEGFLPGGASLHNCVHLRTGRTPRRSPGPAARNWPRRRSTGSLAFMFESRWMIIPTRQAMEAAHRQPDYDSGLGRPDPVLRRACSSAVTEPEVEEAVPQVPGALLPVPPPRLTGMLPLWYQLAQSLRAPSWASTGTGRSGCRPRCSSPGTTG